MAHLGQRAFWSILIALAGSVTAWNVEAAPPKKKTPAVPQQLALKDISPTKAAQANKLVGVRVSGKIEVMGVEPDPNAKGMFRVGGVDTSDKTGGVFMRWVGNRWIKVVCVLTTDEATALRLSKGDELSVAGDVTAVKVLGGQDFVNGLKGRDEIIQLELLNVKAE